MISSAKLLESNFSASEALINAPSKEKIAKIIINSIQDVIPFTILILFGVEKEEHKEILKTCVVRPETLTSKFEHLTWIVPEICLYDYKDDWTYNDCFDCRLCDNWTVISALRRTRLDLNLNKFVSNSFYSLIDSEISYQFTFPITAQKSLYGVLTVCRNKELPEFEKAEIIYLQTLCNNAAIASYGRELFGFLESQVREDNRGEMARDVVHTLAPVSSSFLTHTHLLQKAIEPIINQDNKNDIKKSIEKAYKQIDQILDVTRHQENLIRNYTMISRQTEETQVDILLGEVIGEVLSVNQAKAKSKNIKFVCKQEGKPRSIKAVEMDIYLIFWNLINNAIKFTRGNKSSKITITEKYLENSIIITIRDEGVGIPDENLMLVWKLGFSTVAPGETRKTSGVGLTTVGNLVRKIEGGDIQFKSKRNSFTEFILTFNKQ